MKKNIIAKVLMVVLLMLGIASSVWANGVANKKAVLEGENYVFFIQNINTGYNCAEANKKFGKEAASCKDKKKKHIIAIKEEFAISTNHHPKEY